jgi:hypothetical protein
MYIIRKLLYIFKTMERKKTEGLKMYVVIFLIIIFMKKKTS